MEVFKAYIIYVYCMCKYNLFVVAIYHLKGRGRLLTLYGTAMCDQKRSLGNGVGHVCC